jgi:predicted nicotinamide N-methyase
VLELGCGLGLPSVAAARAGARVTASDWSPPALEATAQNAARAGVRVETVLCAWQRPESIVSRAPFDLVLASDVLYERRQVGLLLGLLPRLVGIRGQVWIADPGRRPAERFLAQAAADWRRRSRRSPERPSVTVHRLRRRR